MKLAAILLAAAAAMMLNAPADAANNKVFRMVPSGNHTAGVQVLNTRNFPNLAGPLKSIQ